MSDIGTKILRLTEFRLHKGSNPDNMNGTLYTNEGSGSGNDAEKGVKVLLIRNERITEGGTETAFDARCFNCGRYFNFTSNVTRFSHCVILFHKIPEY